LLDYITANPQVFWAVFAALLVFNIVFFVIGSRRSERRFKNQLDQQILFRERWVSGFSKRSPITRLGGARRVLEVVVTDRELWIKGVWPMFSFVGTKFDLTHRVPKSGIRKVVARGQIVEIWFLNESGSESNVELELKEAVAFTAAVGATQQHAS
jgi:hypothetical protein